MASQSQSIEIALLNRLWERMAEIYGHRWTSSFGDKPNKSWAVAIEGLTPEEVLSGINRCIAMPSEWPPTASIFRNYCRPVVDYEGAFLAAVEAVSRRCAELDQSWAIPGSKTPGKCLFWAASSMTSDIISMPYEKLRARWKAALDKAIAETDSLDEIPPMAKRIGRSTSGATKVGEQALEKMRAIIGRAAA